MQELHFCTCLSRDCRRIVHFCTCLSGDCRRIVRCRRIVQSLDQISFFCVVVLLCSSPLLVFMLHQFIITYDMVHVYILVYILRYGPCSISWRLKEVRAVVIDTRAAHHDARWSTAFDFSSSTEANSFWFQLIYWSQQLLISAHLLKPTAFDFSSSTEANSFLFQLIYWSQQRVVTSYPKINAGSYIFLAIGLLTWVIGHS